ncbi:MAG: DUF4260 domain-containing protein [Rhodobacteraceae bacterium]|nr:DUF4260 domain-containing protein [Paracoccaceae bacterium]
MNAQPDTIDRGTVIWQRLESLAIAATLLTVYVLSDAASHTSWWFFVFLLVLPDVTLLGYLFGTRYGAFLYNLGHTNIGPGAINIASLIVDVPTLLPIAFAWAIHIAIDRTLGYGIKSTKGFAFTHLSRIGKQKDTR